MDIRYTTNPYIDMDDLAKPWEINRRLCFEINEKEYITKEILGDYPENDEKNKEKEQKENENVVQLTLKMK